jgi:hypothetical protein
MWEWCPSVCRGCGAKLRIQFRRHLMLGLPLMLTGSGIQIAAATYRFFPEPSSALL